MFFFLLNFQFRNTILWSSLSVITFPETWHFSVVSSCYNLMFNGSLCSMIFYIKQFMIICYPISAPFLVHKFHICSVHIITNLNDFSDFIDCVMADLLFHWKLPVSDVMLNLNLFICIPQSCFLLFWRFLNFKTIEAAMAFSPRQCKSFTNCHSNTYRQSIAVEFAQ